MNAQNATPVGVHWGSRNLAISLATATGRANCRLVPCPDPNPGGRLRQISQALHRTASPLVIAVPTFFVNEMRQAIYEASMQAGMRLIRILNATTAAAIAAHDRIAERSLALVLDLADDQVGASLIRPAEQPEVVASLHALRQPQGEPVVPLACHFLTEGHRPTVLILSGSWQDEPGLLAQIARATGLDPLGEPDPQFAAAIGCAQQCRRLTETAG